MWRWTLALLVAGGMLQVVDLRLFTFWLNHDILLHFKQFKISKGRTTRDQHCC